MEESPAEDDEDEDDENNDTDEDIADEDGGISASEPKLENYAIEELERTLERLIAEERYEEASKVSEILKRKRNNKN